MNDWMNDIREVVEKYKPSRIVEVGSADGSISTTSILTGIKNSKYQPEFVFSFEYKKELYDKLKNLQNSEWFHPILSTATKMNDWMTLFDIDEFYRKYDVINRPPINSVFNWYLESVNHLIINPDIHIEGIKEFITNKFGDTFDMILIDGSPFSAESEYDLLKNSKIVILDDINDIKCHKIFLNLLNDKNYFVYKQNNNFCNGYCIFIKNQ